MIRPAVAAVSLLLLASLAAPAAAQIHTTAPQFLPVPGVTQPLLAPSAPAPAPLAPPINPGYAPEASSGISPILTEPSPIYELPQPQLSTTYPAPQLPGPIDQQKMTAYSNAIRAQQSQMQSQGVPLGSTYRGREIIDQLNAPSIQ
jgi:hypothetical protein